MTDLARSVKRSAWMKAWARLGFLVGGVVYMTVGLVAILVAVENRGEPTGPEGAIEQIGKQAFGHILLVVIAIGLFGYAIWCFVQGLFDADRDGSDVKGIIVRVGNVFSGLGYAALGVFALNRFLGSGMPGHSARYWTAELLHHTWGPWLVALTGLVLIGVGIAQLIYGQREGFRRYLSVGDTSLSNRHWIVRLGKYGYSAQGVVLCLIGGFLINAAIRSDPNEAKGLDSALQVLAERSYGPWLLGFVAAGLTCYGLFMILEARFRRLA